MNCKMLRENRVPLQRRHAKKGAARRLLNCATAAIANRHYYECERLITLLHTNTQTRTHVPSKARQMVSAPISIRTSPLSLSLTLNNLYLSLSFLLSISLSQRAMHRSTTCTHDLGHSLLCCLHSSNNQVPLRACKQIRQRDVIIYSHDR